MPPRNMPALAAFDSSYYKHAPNHSAFCSPPSDRQPPARSSTPAHSALMPLRTDPGLYRPDQDFSESFLPPIDLQSLFVSSAHVQSISVPDLFDPWCHRYILDYLGLHL